jgi:hypothetical protein
MVFPILHFYKKNVIGNRKCVAADDNYIPREHLFSCVKRHNDLPPGSLKIRDCQEIWRFPERDYRGLSSMICINKRLFQGHTRAKYKVIQMFWTYA